MLGIIGFFVGGSVVNGGKGGFVARNLSSAENQMYDYSDSLPSNFQFLCLLW